ncbi:unnamed protein product [Ascophyllum nodosum]
MGLRERFLTAGVAIPLALWAIFFDSFSCLVLALGLQAICIHELVELLRKTSPARTLVAAGAHPFSPFLFHMIGLAACSASAFGGRDLYAIALSVGVAALVIRRLVLMRRHQRAALDAAGDGASVITSGVFLLTLEASAIVWVVGGWSSLVGLRFSGPTGATDVVVLLAIVFNSDNGGLLAGSIFKALRRRHGRTLRARPSPSDSPATAAKAAPSADVPSILAIASPNKTWVGVTGAISLGTATALAAGPAIALLSRLVFSLGVLSPEESFSLGKMTPAWLGITGAGVCVLGIVGDLWESLLKRAATVKDSGALFPGHGGCLDRLDGVLAAAPLYLAVVGVLR